MTATMKAIVPTSKPNTEDNRNPPNRSNSKAKDFQTLILLSTLDHGLILAI